MVFLTMKMHQIHCIGQKYFVLKLLFSLCSYVCNGLPGPAHPPKVKYSLRSHQIHCLLPCSYEQRENISLWEGVLVLEDHYIHMNRERTRALRQNISLYINTSTKLCKIKFPDTSPKSSFRQADVMLTL